MKADDRAPDKKGAKKAPKVGSERKKAGGLTGLAINDIK
jgi:hypothetical protein